VQAVDRAGNRASASVNLTIDTVLPDILILSPSALRLFNTTSLEVAWTANGTGSSLSGLSTRLDGGAWSSMAASTEHLSLTSLSQGEHQFDVRVADMAGNVRQASVHFAVDSVAPQVIDHAPVGNHVLLSPEVSVTFSEAMNASSVSFEIAGVTGGMVGWNGNKVILVLSPGLKAGTNYTAMINGNDLAGNRASYEWSFTMESQGSPGQDLSWLWLLLLILIVVGAIIYYLWRRKRRRERKG